MNPWPIAPLGPKDLNFDVVNYNFTSVTAGGLGGLRGWDNAVDALLADFTTSVADQTILIASMAGDLDDLFTILDELSNDDFSQIIHDLAVIQAAGDGMLADLVNLIS